MSSTSTNPGAGAPDAQAGSSLGAGFGEPASQSSPPTPASRQTTGPEQVWESEDGHLLGGPKHAQRPRSSDTRAADLSQTRG